ncbi:MAG: T9SS type A sorting domain-containing protein [Saprospiraceae bacterium]
MKHQLFFLLIATFISTKFQAQCPDSITFSTQAQINSFSTDYPGCTVIPGDVTIKGTGITDLNGLLGLTSVGGNLRIDSNIVLSSLLGLDSLKTVGGDFTIIQNYNLLNLSGLENLTFVNGEFAIIFSGGLTALTNFNKLRSLGKHLTVFGNAALSSLNGLDSIRSVAGDINLWKNDGLNDFTGLNQLDSISGSLSIGGNAGLNNLNGFDKLRFIGGTLFIGDFFGDFNSSLTSLSGLENLKTISGGLHIFSNPLLSDLSSLDALSTISSLQIFSNPLLSDLSGLDSINTVAGDITITENASMTSLSGLENIVDIGGTLKISANPILPDLLGLDALQSIGSLEISSNPLLQGLSGLDTLKSVGSFLLISGNPLLQDLSGLDALKVVGDCIMIKDNENLLTLNGVNSLDSIIGENVLGGVPFSFRGLWVLNNPNLANLQGLENVGFIRDILILNNPALSDLSAFDRHFHIRGNLHISENPLLAACAVQSICDYLDDPPGNVTIHTNAPGCNFPTEVLAVCKGFSNVIQGILFQDEGNCLYDSTEQTLKQWLVKAESDSLTFYAVTDTAGRFSMLVDTGTYALSAQLPSALWELCDTVHIAFNQLFQTIDTFVGVKAIVDCPLLNLDIATNILRRCFDNFYNIKWCNEGTVVAESTYIELNFDPLFQVDTSTFPGTWADLGGNRFSIDLGDVPPGDCGSFSVKVAVPCDAVLGETKCVTAHIFPDTICLFDPNWDGSNIVVTVKCSGDTVFFTIKNTGTGDMVEFSSFIIVEDVVLRQRGEFKLQSGADTVVVVANANNHTWRLEANQHPAHPFSRVASVAIEGCPDSTIFSVILQFPHDEARPSIATDCHSIVGSWDPNEKIGFPQGLGNEHTIRDNTRLEYLIGFQNTGTDTAFHVVLRDTLSPYLDPATVRPGASSHPYRFEMSENGNLKFTFNNIMLPDSNTNEVASHGFVQYSVAQKSLPANPPGTVIENMAAIYFDYNAPVVTNKVSHTVAKIDTLLTEIRKICGHGTQDTILKTNYSFSYHDLTLVTFVEASEYETAFLDTLASIGDTIFGIVYIGPVTVLDTLISENGCDTLLFVHITTPTYSAPHLLPFLLYPNPTRSDLTLRYTPAMQEWDLSIEIHDTAGRLRQTLSTTSYGSNSGFLKIPVSDLPNGVYFLSARSPNGTWTGKFVKLN